MHSSVSRNFRYSSGLGASFSHKRAAVPMRMSRPVLKRKAPSVAARSITAATLVNIQSGRRKSNFEWQSRRADAAARRVRLLERRTRPLSCVDSRRIAIETDLDRAYAQARESLGELVVELLAIGFNLELNTGFSEPV